MSWVPPKFVKEWELTNLDTTLSHHIISLTATKNGLFVLVREEGETYTPPSKWDKLSEGERQSEISTMKLMFGRILSEEERLADKGGLFSKKTAIVHYRVQQYSIDGRFIRQWPEASLQISSEMRKKTPSILIRKGNGEKEIESTLELVTPENITSDIAGNIYVVDYQGNKLIKFNDCGKVVNMWAISGEKPLGGYYDTLGYHHGLSIWEDKLYLVSTELAMSPSAAASPFIPRIAAYDVDGILISDQKLDVSLVSMEHSIDKKSAGVAMAEENIQSLAIGKEGNLFLLIGDTTIVKLDKTFRKTGQFQAILRTGLDRPKPVYDPTTKKTINYEEIVLKGTGIPFNRFSSDKLAWSGNPLGLYNASKISISPNGELYVTFTGSKAFGTIDALVISNSGQMLGYWKRAKKSHSKWFNELTDLEKLETTDDDLDIAFYGNKVFIGRTLQEGGSKRRYHAVIQEFVR